MSTQEKYQNLINQERGVFADICDIMLHSKVEDGRKFLCAMNNIVDYYCERKHEGEINYQII